MAVALVGTAMGACSAPGGPGSVKDWNWRPDAGGTESDGGLPPTTSALTCTPARASESIPARSTVMAAEGGSVGGGDIKVRTEDLFNLFKATCGGCHAGPGLGNFNVTAQTFHRVVDQKVIDVITSDDPAKYMPPPGAGGAPYSARTGNDPIVQLATLLQHWLSQGRSEVLFTVPSGGGGGGTTNSYALAPQVGMQLTNIGDCVPGRGMIGSSESTIDDMDQFFAGATALPETLAETDLVTFDGATLAQASAVAFAPQYPLWSDGSGKLRHIRLPRGESVKFDKATQEFHIPPNTRFYKTFLKKVTDSEGNERHRKIETRLIVARPDKQLPDGRFEPQALFGTYIWSDDEMSASLSNVPLNNHTGFTDRVISYTLDEPKYQMILDSMPANLKFALDGVPGLSRHYAVPGSQRCIECHMGSPGANFVLGFIPMQIVRRPDGEGGGYEPTGEDELSQMQRMIDYGIVTGMSSPADVVLLEQSQGDRKARNDHELVAQAYMLGNCAHCHSPRGFPTIKSPALKDVLDFMPSKTGGIFQFPLERYSPLRNRGANQDVPIPYITPSLREYPVASETTPYWTPKWRACIAAADAETEFLCKGKTGTSAHLAAPWRSLIYRNVDTPFMYADDFALFPHMPMHTAGHDCRVAPMMGDWMVSIPAVRKKPTLDEDAVPLQVGNAAMGRNSLDTNPQPYAEVAATDSEYAVALRETNKRLTEYRQSSRYSFCPDQTDIVDMAVVRAGGAYPLVPETDAVYDPNNAAKIVQPATGVPNRAHFVVTDLTDLLGDWYPRRTSWDDVLVANQVDRNGLPLSPDAAELELKDRQNVLDILQQTFLTQAIKDLALKEEPFGLWQPKAECQLSSLPKVGDFTGDVRPRWMTLANSNPSPTAAVYMQSPGAAVFSNICINCHGPQADSRGLLAEAIANMTGGTGRVANFRDGFFGPTSSPGSNRGRIFDPFAKVDPLHPPAVSGEDWAARYMAWMALGGTLVRIPEALLNLVATTPVLGVRRSTRYFTATGSPNMLKLAQTLCQQVLPADFGVVTNAALDGYFFQNGTLNWTMISGLIDSNYDAQMWQRLCSLGNRPVVRVPIVNWNDPTDPKIDPIDSLFFGDAYPADAPVMDDKGRVTNGIQPGNVFPLCFRKPPTPQQVAVADQYIAAHRVGGPQGSPIPYCPPSLFERATDPDSGESREKWLLKSVNRPEAGRWETVDANKWAIRGAINAGLVVFTYLDELVKGKVTPKPEFNRCEKLMKN